jgi:hypothetical protein
VSSLRLRGWRRGILPGNRYIASNAGTILLLIDYTTQAAQSRLSRVRRSRPQSDPDTATMAHRLFSLRMSIEFHANTRFPVLEIKPQTPRAGLAGFRWSLH